MALNGQDFAFHLSVASGHLDAQPDPDQSLGGYQSVTRAEKREGAVTTQVSDFVFTDTSQIDDKPVSPDPRTPLADSDDYSSSSDLVHWYRLSVDDADMGKDYATAGTPIDLTQSSNLDGTDVVALQPGQFDQQRNSVVFAQADDDTVRKTSTSVYGLANAWSVGIWLRSTSGAAGIHRCFRLDRTATSQGLDEITIYRDGGFLHVEISDDTTAVDRIHHVYSSPIINTWTHYVLTWDGATLQLYKDGSPLAPSFTTENDSVTQSDSARYLLISGLRATFVDPFEEWEGQIHSVAMWDSVLTAAEIADLTDFGDGPGEPVLDHVGKWVAFVTGNNAVDARQVIYHDNTTGDIGVFPAWSSTPLVTEVFRVGWPLSIFDDVSVLECAGGHVDHRCLFVLNSTGVSLSDIRFYLQPLDPGSTEMEVVAGNLQKGSNPVTPSADEEDAPFTDTTGTNGFTSNTPQRFRQGRDYAEADDTPQPSFNLNNGFNSALWLRRTIPVLAKKFDNAAWLLVAEQDTAVKTAVPIVFNLDGFNPQLAAEFDRTPRTFGGARITATVEDADFGFPIEDEEVDIAIDSGPGTLNSDPQPLETDEDGEVRAVYLSPEDDAQAGATVVIEAKMGGDL